MNELNISKRWFNKLTTYIIMIMLLLVVLSTATFAWYSVANIATASDITFQATSQQEGGDLCVGWEPTDSNYNITFDSITSNQGISPMIPTIEGVVNTTKYADFFVFNKATQSYDTLGQLITRLSGDYMTNPYLLKSEQGKTTFYLINKSSSAMRISLSYTIAGITNQETDEVITKFRCAFFTSDVTKSTPILRGIMSNSDKIHYGVLEDNQPVSSTPIMTDGYRATQEIIFDIPADSYVSARAMAWFDGVDMQNEDGSKAITLMMDFKGNTISDE